MLAAFLVIGDSRVAVPAALIDTAIGTPVSLGPPLAGKPAMLGTFEHAGAAFPLIDLGSCLGLTSPGAARGQAVVLIEAGGKRVGVVVDRVDSVRALRCDSVARLSTADGQSPYAIAKVADYAEPVVVLEERDLLGAAGMVFADAPVASRARRPAAAPRGEPGNGDAFLSFSRSGTAFAIPVSQISEIIIAPKPVSLALPVPHVTGRITTRQDEVMLLDHPAPGSGEMPDRTVPGHALVLQIDGLRFAVPVDAIHTIAKLASAQMCALPGETRAPRGPVSGLASSPGGGAPQIVIDEAAVLAMPGIRTLIEHQNRTEHKAAASQASGETRTFVELVAGGHFFVRLEDVREIATIPRASIVLGRARAGIDGYAQHRGSGIAIVDLVARLAPGTAVEEAAKVVVVSTQDGAGDAGFIVEDALSMAHFQIHGNARSHVGTGGGDAHGTPAFSQHWRLLDAKSRQGARIISVLDLVAIARDAQDVPRIEATDPV